MEGYGGEGYGSGMGGYGSGYGSGEGGYGGGDYNGECCEKKVVRDHWDEKLNGVYMLYKVAEWDQLPYYCNSPCVYVKEDMDGMMGGEEGEGMEGYGSGYGYGSGRGYGSGYGYGSEMMKKQKFCFKPSKYSM